MSSIWAQLLLNNCILQHTKTADVWFNAAVGIEHKFICSYYCWYKLLQFFTPSKMRGQLLYCPNIVPPLVASLQRGFLLFCSNTVLLRLLFKGGFYLREACMLGNMLSVVYQYIIHGGQIHMYMYQEYFLSYIPKKYWQYFIWNNTNKAGTVCFRKLLCLIGPSVLKWSVPLVYCRGMQLLRGKYI